MLSRPARIWLTGAVAVAVAALAAFLWLLTAVPVAAVAVVLPRPSPPPSALLSSPVSVAALPELALPAGASEAQRLYATALLAVDCRQRAQAPAPSVVLPPGVDDTTAEDAAARRAAEGQWRAACRGVGQVDAAQIEAMLRTAATRGDPDAQRYLLNQRVAQLFAHAGDIAPDGQRPRLSAADERDAEDVVTQLEDRALHGDRQSIETLAQLLQSPALAVADPPYAAAWELAARQAPERPFPPPEQAVGAEELLDGLNEAQRQQALGLAPMLFAQCCARR